MATLGISSIADLALKSLWDLSEIRKLQLQDGATFETVVQDVNGAMQAFNREMVSMPHYSELLAVQDDVDLEYPVGVTNGVQDSTEFGRPDPKRGKTTGHSLPVRPYDRGLGWTMRFLRKARITQIDADVRSAVTDLRNHWQQALLTRLFKMEGETVGATANASVPLADGGTTDANFIPPQSPDGENFLATHDHFLRLAALSTTNIEVAVEHLQEHGHVAPYNLIGSKADIATYTGLTEFKKPEWAGLTYREATDRAKIAGIEDFIGYIETDYGLVRVWVTPRVPTAYFAVYKPYGPGDARNPLRVRIDPLTGFGWQLVPGVWLNAPEMMAVLYAEYGIGIGEDRTNGVCVEIDASGDYASPTIS